MAASSSTHASALPGSTTVPAAPASPRLHHLDALRGGALLFGVVLHVVIGFVPGASWMFEDEAKAGWALPVTFLIHLSRMVLFMMLAGYFGRMVLHRRGAGAYLKDRLLRIGLPLLAFWPLAILSLPVVITLGSRLRGVSPSQDAGTGEEQGLLMLFTPGQLWFLLLLLEIALVVVAVRAVLVMVLGGERAGAIARRIGDLLGSPAGIVLAAVPYALGLLAQGSDVGGIDAPTTILPVAGASIAYSGAFLVGWFLHASPASLDRMARGWPAKLAIAAVLSVAAYLVSGQSLLLSSVLVPLAAWSWVHALVGAAGRFLNREIRSVRYLADASYWIYLLHLPLVVAFGMAMADLPWPAPVKVLLNVAATTGVLVLGYDLFVRSTWLGSWLNGRRRPRAIFTRRRAVEAAPASAES